MNFAEMVDNLITDLGKNTKNNKCNRSNNKFWRREMATAKNSQASGDQPVQRDDTNHNIFIINDGQELHW